MSNFKKCGFVLIVAFIALITVTRSFANLPIPESPPDHYLDGVKRIVIWSSSRTISPTSAFLLRFFENEIDYEGLNKQISHDLSDLLKPDVKKKITIETLDSAKVDPWKITDEDILLIHFDFGFQLSRFEGKEIILGAVYPTVQRLPPVQMRGDRTSGFYQHPYWAVSGRAFVFNEDEVITAKSLQPAIQPSVEHLAQWLNARMSVAEVQK